MCLRDELLGLLLPRHQPVLVEDHLHALFPELPGLGGDIFVDPLAQLAGPGLSLEPGQLLLEFLAEHRAARPSPDGIRSRNVIEGSLSETSCIPPLLRCRNLLQHARAG